MEIIYNASNLNEAHIVAGLLNANGIETHVGGHYLQGGIGELAASDFVSIHVADDDVAPASAIIAEYESSNEHLSKHGDKSGNISRIQSGDELTENRRNSYITPLLVIVLSLLLILLLTFLFSGQQV